MVPSGLKAPFVLFVERFLPLLFCVLNNEFVCGRIYDDK